MRNLGCYVPTPEECYPEDRWFIRDKEKIELNFVMDCGDKYIYSPDRCKLGCPKPYIDKLDTIEFRGRKVYIPSNAKEYLAFSYGDDWLTPIRDKKPKSL
jgi:phosphorylcholine metabolism protein LicD